MRITPSKNPYELYYKRFRTNSTTKESVQSRFGVILHTSPIHKACTFQLTIDKRYSENKYKRLVKIRIAFSASTKSDNINPPHIMNVRSEKTQR